MKCGHTPNVHGEPFCVICLQDELMKEPVDLTGRKARCTYGCQESIVDSRENLAFFKHQKDLKYDSYYCGCFGWN